MRTGAGLLADAYDFAARAHVHQRRKGAAGEPYINHLTEVVALLARSGRGNDTDLLIAGVLHDAVEDCGIALSDIAKQFGGGVASIVDEVTDDKSLPKLERKARQVAEAPHKSTSARLLKLADKTSNLRSLVNSPPADWTTRRVSEYADWAEKVVAGCRGLDPYLEEQFDDALLAARATQKKQKAKT